MNSNGFTQRRQGAKLWGGTSLRLCALACGVFFGLLAAGPAWAADTYVSKTNPVGSDAYAGDSMEPLHPYLTIQKGIDNVGSGDMVWVNPGTYTEALLLNATTHNINGKTITVSAYVGAASPTVTLANVMSANYAIRMSALGTPTLFNLNYIAFAPTGVALGNVAAWLIDTDCDVHLGFTGCILVRPNSILDAGLIYAAQLTGTMYTREYSAVNCAFQSNYVGNAAGSEHFGTLNDFTQIVLDTCVVTGTGNAVTDFNINWTWDNLNLLYVKNCTWTTGNSPFFFTGYAETTDIPNWTYATLVWIDGGTFACRSDILCSESAAGQRAWIKESRATNVTVQNCRNGLIDVVMPTSLLNVSGCSFSFTTPVEQNGYAIKIGYDRLGLTEPRTQAVIRGNAITGAAGANTGGILVGESCQSAEISYNTFDLPGGIALKVAKNSAPNPDRSGSGIHMHHNKVWAETGAFVGGGIDFNFHNNTVLADQRYSADANWRCLRKGVYFNGLIPTGWHIQENILWAKGAGARIFEDDAEWDALYRRHGMVVDGNCYYVTDGGVLARWGGVDYTTGQLVSHIRPMWAGLSDDTVESGSTTPGTPPFRLNDANSFEADPRFINAAAGDFRLLPSSPCLDTNWSAPARKGNAIGSEELFPQPHHDRQSKL